MGPTSCWKMVACEVLASELKSTTNSEPMVESSRPRVSTCGASPAPLRQGSEANTPAYRHQHAAFQLCFRSADTQPRREDRATSQASRHGRAECRAHCKRGRSVRRQCHGHRLRTHAIRFARTAAMVTSNPASPTSNSRSPIAAGPGSSIAAIAVFTTCLT
jgi:hypothetical protein